MSEGQRAAEDTKDVFKGIGQAGEDIRKNINSFTDNLVGGNKTHESTGIHPDVKRTGQEIKKGTDAAGAKIGEHSNRNTNTTH